MSPVVYFDLETGGIDPDSPVIQLAAVAIDQCTWRELDSFEKKLLFDESLADPEALALNHYDPDVWRKEAFQPQVALRDFAVFLNPYRSVEFVSKKTGNPYSVAKLAGHNAANFDAPRLQRMYSSHGIFLGADPRVRCTYQLAMWWFDAHALSPKSFKLGDLCEYFGLEGSGAHDALADVRMTVALARRLSDWAAPID